MDITIKAITQEGNKVDNLISLGGKFGAVCYSENYKESKYLTDEYNLKRAYRAIKAGHHSIFDHTNITIMFDRIPKMVAMVLNSLGAYSASERSARYTQMIGETEEEREIYNYWKERLRGVIVDRYKGLEGRAEKLAQENARYMLSVFTPTTLIYTTTLKQWNYIIQWGKEKIQELEQLEDNIYRERLIKGLGELVIKLEGQIKVEGLDDIRHRGYEFLVGDKLGKILDASEVVDYVYKVHYKISLSALAQAERHRTLKYSMIFDGYPREFYIPPILSGKDIDKWNNDAERLVRAGIIPQCTMVDVIERGCIEDLVLKCKDRLCGRAQLEVMESTKNIIEKVANESYKAGRGDLLDILIEYISIENKGVEVLPRCSKHNCIEGCEWGISSLKRRI